MTAEKLTAPESPASFVLTLRGPRVVFGEGVAETQLASELDRLSAQRVLVVGSTREQQSRTNILDRAADRIAGTFCDVRRNVPLPTALAATSRALAVRADCLLSLGGGSAVGTAKAVALETGLPVLAIPTTYAGFEYTPIYGITGNSVKRTGRADTVLPRTVLLDPGLARGLPPDIARPSAVNARQRVALLHGGARPASSRAHRSWPRYGRIGGRDH